MSLIFIVYLYLVLLSLKYYLNFFFNFIFLFFMLFSGMALSNDQCAHLHGKASGVMVISESDIVLELRIPAESVLGFEHVPKSKEDKRRVDQALERLEEPGLMTFFKNKGWFSGQNKLPFKTVEHTIELDMVHEKDHKKPNLAQNEKHTHDHHESKIGD